MAFRSSERVNLSVDEVPHDSMRRFDHSFASRLPGPLPQHVHPDGIKESLSRHVNLAIRTLMTNCLQ